MIRSPDLSIPQMEALQLLLKVDYTRAVRCQLQWQRNSHPEVETVLAEIVRLTDAYNDRHTPLTVGAVIAEAERGHTRLLLNETRFDYYVRMADLIVGPKDFPGVDPADIAAVLPELQKTQLELRLALKNATYMHPHKADKPTLN